MKCKLRVGFQQLHILCIIGTLPEERLIPQPIVVSLETRVLDPNTFVDYCTLAEMTIQLAKESSFFLLEEYGAALCREILKNPLIDSVKVHIQKPGAIFSSQGAFVEMEVSR